MCFLVGSIFSKSILYSPQKTTSSKIKKSLMRHASAKQINRKLLDSDPFIPEATSFPGSRLQNQVILTHFQLAENQIGHQHKK